MKKCERKGCGRMLDNECASFCSMVCFDSYNGEDIEDPVNHPNHYTQFPVEIIEITEHLNFCKGNAVKYVARSEFKGNEIQDLEKAKWYIEREIKRLKMVDNKEKE